MRIRLGMPVSMLSLLALVGGSLLNTVPASAAGPQTLVIGVDHLDFANQRPDQGRLLEYTDFFSRSVTVHQGDTLDFNFVGFHIIAVARNEEFAKDQQALGSPDADDSPAAGTGKSKISLNPVVFAFGSGCGWGTAAPCDYRGGNDLKISGPPTAFPAPSNWNVTVNAQPGNYVYFCYIHPGMRGKLHVVGADEPTTSQAQNDLVSQQQFEQDQAQALQAESAADVVRFSGDEPGERTYFVKVGISAADNHVAIDEMFPNSVRDPSKQLNLVAGDRVQYTWPDGHNAHSVTYPPDAVGPFGFDCNSGYVFAGPPCTETGEPPELIVDPGNAASGTALTAPGTILDAGVHLGTDLGLPTSTRFSVTTGAATAPGTYHFNCNIHDFMVGTVNVAANGGEQEHG